VQVKVEVCGEAPNVTLVALRVHVRPTGDEADTVRLAIPLPVAETVIVDVPMPPGKIWAGLTTLAVTEVMANPTVTVTGTLTV
jgi:hypothetical protein